MKVTVIKIKTYHQQNAQIKLNLNYFQESDIWKIQLTIAINLIFSKDVDEDRVMHSLSDNKEFMP